MKQLKAGRGTIGKSAVVGSRERYSGRNADQPIESTDKGTLHRVIGVNFQ